MKNFPGINASIIDGEVERKYWSIVDYYLRELTRGTAKVIDDVNSPGLNTTDPGTGLINFLYLPGRIGGQTLRRIDLTNPAFAILGSDSDTVSFRVVGTGNGFGLEVRTGANASTMDHAIVKGTLLVDANGGQLRIKPNSATIDYVSSSVHNFGGLACTTFQFSGSSPLAGKVLTSSDGTGHGTWSTAASIVDVARVWGTLQEFPPSTLRFDSGAAPGSPSAGDIWLDSTQKSFIGYPDGVKQTLDGTLFTMIASQTRAGASPNVENSLLTTGIGTLTVPANWWAPGKTLILLVNGYYGCVAAATMRLRVKLTDTTPTTVTVADTTASTLATAATNKAFSMAVVITCRTTGAPGTGFAQMYSYFEKNANFEQTPNTATFTFDTTKANTIDLTELWGASTSGTNTITASDAVLKVVN